MATLSDVELKQIAAAAAPLQPQVREAFVREVVSSLQGEVIGPGTVHRAIATVQKKFVEFADHALGRGCAGRR